MSLFLETLRRQESAHSMAGAARQPAAGTDVPTPDDLTLQPTDTSATDMEHQSHSVVPASQPPPTTTQRAGGQTAEPQSPVPPPPAEAVEPLERAELQTQPPTGAEEGLAAAVEVSAAPGKSQEAPVEQAEQATGVARLDRLSNFRVLEPALLLVAAVSALGLLIGLYLFVASVGSHADSEAGALQVEMRGFEARMTQLQQPADARTVVDDTSASAKTRAQPSAASPSADAAPDDAAAAAEPPARESLAQATPQPTSQPTPQATPQSASQLTPQMAPQPTTQPAPAAPAAVPQEAIAERQQLANEMDQLRKLIDAQSARIDSLIDENKRLRTAPAVPVAEKTVTVEKRPDPPIQLAKRSQATAEVVLDEPRRKTDQAGNRGIDGVVGVPVNAGAVEVNDRFKLLLRQGDLAFNAGDFRRADSFYDQALLLQPYDRQVNLSVAAVASRMGDYGRAESRYRHLLALDSKDSAAFTGMLELAAATQDPTLEQDMRSHVNNVANTGRMYAALGNYFNASRRWEDAGEAWRQALQRDVSNPDFAFNLAVSMDNLSRHQLAIEHYRLALDYADRRTHHFARDATQARIRLLQAAR